MDFDARPRWALVQVRPCTRTCPYSMMYTQADRKADLHRLLIFCKMHLQVMCGELPLDVAGL